MPAKVKDIDKMLLGKLEATSKEGTNHTKYFVQHEDTLLGSTVLSRSYREVDDSMLSAIAKQLHIKKPGLDKLLECHWYRDDYIRQVLQG